MNTNHKLGSVRELALFGRLLRGSLIATAVFALAFVVAPYIITEANAQNVASVGVTWEAVSLTLDPDYGNGSIDDEGHGNVEFGNITPTSTNTAIGNYGTQRVIKKTIGIKTPGKYYSVYLSMVGNSNALEMDGTDMTIDAIDASWNGTGTSAPKAFSSTAWGFAVPTTQTGTYATPFTGDYTAYDSYLGRDLTANGTGSTAYNTATWASVPVSGSAQQIWKATTSNNNGFGTRTEDEQTVAGDTTKDHFSVYYSVMVDTDKIAGTYANQVVYTAIASSQSLDEVSQNLSRSVEYVKAGTRETLSFDLSASVATIPRGKVKVYLVPHVLADHNNYESIEGFSAYAVQANECRTTSDSDWVVTDRGATITCTMPAAPGGVDDGVTPEGTISVEEDDGNGGTTMVNLNVQKGEFDFWVTIADYGYNYISQYTRSTTPVASVLYAGLQSKDANDQPYFTKMQEMTAITCENTNKWGNTTTYDSSTQTLDPTRVTLANPTGTTLTSANIKTDGTKDDIGTFELTDSRDNKTYLVRKLADNNCWMVQNLDLDLAAAQAGTISLTNMNTDIDYARTSGRTGWVPGATQQAEADAMGEGKSFADVAEARLGTRQTYQFQPRGSSGAGYRWGSLYNENVECNIVEGVKTCTASYDPTRANKALLDGTDLEVVTGTTERPKNRSFSYKSDGTYVGRNETATITGSTWVENNSLAAIPRSYDNGADWISNMTTSNADGTGDNHKTSGTPTSASEYLGDFYNWYAATAESGAWDMDTESVDGSAPDSICPYGWQLPVNGAANDKSWGKLTGSYSISSNATGSRSLRSFPLSVIMSGNYGWVYGNLYSRGTGGYFWSSTPYAVTGSHYLYFNSTYVSPQGGLNKANGFTVRCVAR